MLNQKEEEITEYETWSEEYTVALCQYDAYVEATEQYADWLGNPDIWLDYIMAKVTLSYPETVYLPAWK